MFFSFFFILSFDYGGRGGWNPPRCGWVKRVPVQDGSGSRRFGFIPFICFIKLKSSRTSNIGFTSFRPPPKNICSIYLHRTKSICYRYLHIIVCHIRSRYNGYNASPNIPSDVKHARSGCCAFRLLLESKLPGSMARDSVKQNGKLFFWFLLATKAQSWFCEPQNQGCPTAPSGALSVCA